MVAWFMKRLRHRHIKSIPAQVSREQTVQRLREGMALLEQQSNLQQKNKATARPRHSAHRVK